MLASRRIHLRRIPAVVAACACALALCVGAPAALAAGPASVTVRVEGLGETKLPSTQVTTGTTPLSKDGIPAHACAGTSALAALDLATSGNWSGPWNAEFKQYELFTIEGETHLFEPGAPANYYWSFWIDEHEASAGACEADVQQGDRVLFFPACFGAACPPAQLPLGITAPASANVGEPVGVSVRRYSTAGVATPAAGASVAGGESAVSTDAGGGATVRFNAPGQYTLRASAAESVRTETTVCVHAGNDGTCGTAAHAAPSPAAAPTAPAAPYRGAFAVVASVLGLSESHVYAAHAAPRLLGGTVTAHVAVTSVSLELRRSHRGRCSTYDGVRGRFLPARCGTGRSFQVASGRSFSYLLPFALPSGRYVLDILAADAAGNTVARARGTSRIVFYVR